MPDTPNPPDRPERKPRVEGRVERREPPPKEVIATLPPFAAIGLDRIRVVTTAQQVDAAARVLQASRHVGFDTESKPTFVRGEVSDGPHLVQFATLDQAFLLPLHAPGCLELVADLMRTDAVIKVGFGLDSDRTLLGAKLGVASRGVLDLDAIFRRMGYRRSLGLKSAVAVVFGQQFGKSKKVGTSNWAMPRLSDRQMLYAANDAYAAIRVFHALPPAAVMAAD